MMKNSFNLQQTRPELTEDEKKFALSELYYRHLPGPDAEVLYGIEYHKEMDPEDAYLDLQELLIPGYPKRENGYCNLPNGGAYVAICTKFYNCTFEMYEFWRNWRHNCSEEETQLRYKLWCPGSHVYYGAVPKDGTDISGTFDEDLGGGVVHLSATKQHTPDQLFDEEAFKNSPIVRIHGASGLVEEELPYCGLHHIRLIEGGFEIRSRFWFGYTIEDKQLKFVKPDNVKMDPEFVYAYAHHVANEIVNLRTLVPVVWETQRDK